jgi:integrase/recombinase XerD
VSETTSPLRHARQKGGGGASVLQKQALTPTSPLRHGNQRGSVSGPANGKLAKLLEAYEEALWVRHAARTVPAYLADVRALLEWLEEHGIELQEVRTQDLLAYQADLLAARKPDGRPYSASLHTNRITAMKSFFRFLYRRGFLLQDPAAAVEYPRVEHRLPANVLTRQEARRIVEAPDAGTNASLRDRAILETFYATGLRVSELSRLTLQDVDTEERLLRVVQGKGGKDRNLPLTAAAAEALAAYLQQARPRMRGARRSPLLFLAPRGGRMHTSTLNDVVHLWAKKVGIKRRVTCHTFRHSVATHLLKGGADIRHIQALLGHGSLQTTERYTRVEISDLKDVIRRAHPRGK